MRTLQKYTFISFNLHDEEMSIRTKDMQLITYANEFRAVRFYLKNFLVRLLTCRRVLAGKKYNPPLKLISEKT